MGHDTPRFRQAKDLPPLDPALFDSPEMLAALAAHDIATVYRLLTTPGTGISQREIAQRTGQSQSEVSEILQGRTVGMYKVLVRICEGLGLAREPMGLSYGSAGTYGGRVTLTMPEQAAAMLRRHLIALGGIAITGTVVDQLGGPLAELPSRPALPFRLEYMHVTQVQDLTRRLAEAGNSSICAPDVLDGAAAWARQLLDVPGAESVRRSLMVAVAELHIEAGWSAFHTDLRYQRAMHHYARALELATDAGDAYCQTIALRYAGVAAAEQGHPDDGLKMLQCAQVAAWNVPPDQERTVIVGEIGRAAVEATGLANAATALAMLGHYDTAAVQLTKARDLWTPARADPFGDLDRPTAELELRRGRLDVAEQLATASVRRWADGSPTSRTLSGIVQATVHVRAGDSGGLGLAHTAIIGVSGLGDARTRKRLEPLADVLESRSGAGARQLARQARAVATGSA